MKQRLLPTKIVRQKNVENAKALKIRKPVEVVLRSDKEWLNNQTIINGKGYLIVDFGKEMNGGIRIVTGYVNHATDTKIHYTNVRIRFGESLSETCSDVGQKGGAENAHSARDFNAIIASLGNVRFGNTGFRFVRIDFLDEMNVVLQNIYCENEIFSKKPIYRYNGQDKQVKKIFNVAKRTIDLCSAGQHIWDGIKRDRLIWIGDMHPEMLSLTTLYGKTDKVEKTLEFVRDNTPFNLWMNGIASYSMWWMIIVSDYYKLAGAKEFAKNQINYIKGLINSFDQHIADDGSFDFGWLFVDWPTSDTGDDENGVRAIGIMAFSKTIELLKDFGEDITLAQKVLDKLNKKPIEVVRMKQVIALKYMATGVLTDYDYTRLIDGGAKGMSTFMSYYILKTIASRDVNKAIEIMKEYYGAMLNVGATTFFEDFNMDWTENCSRIDKFPKKGQKDIHGDFGDYCYVGFRHSLCHGWSTGVIRFIKEYESFM